MNLVYIVSALFLPSVTLAFDYGPVWNDLFWVVLAVWSMSVSYVLLKKRHKLWALIGSLTHALLTPGVRPMRPVRTHTTPHVRKSHMVADAHIGPTPSHGTTPVPPTQVHVASTPPPNHEHVHVLPQRPTVQQRAQSVPAPISHPVVAQPVVHSTHMSHTAHSTPPAPHVSVPTAVQTADTLTLEIIAGVPKLILKREAKK